MRSAKATSLAPSAAKLVRGATRPTMPVEQHARSPVVRANKGALRKRMNRIEGQVRGIAKMIEDDRYCIDVLTQVGAVKSALDSVGLLLLEDHVEHCLVDAVSSGEGEGKARELSDAIGRFVRS